MHCKSILGLVDTHYDLVCRTEVFGTKLKFCQTILTLSAFVISFSMLSENKLKVHVHAVYRKTSNFAVIYTANVYRDLQGLCSEIGVQGFQIYGDCMYTHNPCNLKSPHSDFHCNICREFDFTGILWTFPALDVGKPCNYLIFGINQKKCGLFYILFIKIFQISL